VPEIDCLAFGPHPDDAELFCGGVLLKLKKQGCSTAIIDLTQAELSTNGNPKLRSEETIRASEILNLDYRKNLKIPDGNIDNTQINRKLVIEITRELRPRICLLPYWQDRHPDHVAASLLLQKALFDSGLQKIKTGQQEYRPQILLYYMLHYEFQPSFVVDISDEMDKKTEAIMAYRSQFSQGDISQAATYINRPEFLHSLQTRAAWFGQQVGVKYAEPYYYPGRLKIDNILRFFA
jgi:bacillithiol biosynthesis deacetylase BshB1